MHEHHLQTFLSTWSRKGFAKSVLKNPLHSNVQPELFKLPIPRLYPRAGQLEYWWWSPDTRTFFKDGQVIPISWGFQSVGHSNAQKVDNQWLRPTELLGIRIKDVDCFVFFFLSWTKLVLDHHSRRVTVKNSKLYPLWYGDLFMGLFSNFS